MSKHLIWLVWLWLAVPAAAQQPDQIGPAQVELAEGLGTLKLPAGFAYFGKASTLKLFEQEGTPDGTEIGLVVSSTPGDDFALFIGYEPYGFVDDREASQLDPDALLKGLQADAEVTNQERAKKGLYPLQVESWIHEPSYDPHHHLIQWAVRSSGGDHRQVDWNSRLLTRYGVLSEELVSDQLERDLPRAEYLLKHTKLAKGQSYEEHQPGEKRSQHGLTHLISKSMRRHGLLALLWNLKKVLAMGLIGIIYWWRRYHSDKKP